MKIEDRREFKEVYKMSPGDIFYFASMWWICTDKYGCNNGNKRTRLCVSLEDGRVSYLTESMSIKLGNCTLVIND